MDTITEEQLTLFAVDSPVKTFRQQANKKALVENDPVYIPKCCELLASVCRDTQFLKTSQGCLLETVVGGSDNFSMTWPRSGSMQSGTVFALAPLDCLKKEIESGLLPTPTASDYKGGSLVNRSDGGDRNSELKHWWTMETGKLHLNPNFVEILMGFPINHTDLNS
mgnify:CR=1 FL=1